MLTQKRIETANFITVLMIILLIYSALPSLANAAKNEVHLGIQLTSSSQRDLLSEIASDFTNETGITVFIHAGFDSDYKQSIASWMTSESPPDVIMWQAGERLLKFIKQDKVLPLSDLWRSQKWKTNIIKAVQESVRYNNVYYALPYTYYTWGMYYKESLFQKLGISPPKDWPELLKFCDDLRAQNIAPFAAGIKNAWPAAAWFDYIDLRLNGLDFHREITAGLIPYTDPRIVSVLQHWKQLIDHQCFVGNANKLDWIEAIPLLYYNNAAMMLMGNFIVGQFSAPLKRDFRFTPFPKIVANMPAYENAPTDVFFIPKKALNLTAAKQLIVFLGRPDIIEKLSNISGMLPTNLKSKINTDYFSLAHSNLLKKSKGVAQFYDRDVPPEMDKIATPILAKFMRSGDIEKTIAELENARQSVYIIDK